MSAFKKLYEDSTMPSGNKFSAQSASRELKGNPINMSSLFNKVNQYPNETRGNNAMPHELNTSADLVGQIVVSTENLYSQFSAALSNPSIENKKLLRMCLFFIKMIAYYTKKLANAAEKVIDR
jgi:hypothetical protein